MTRLWPWAHRHDPHPDLPPVEDGRGEAWAAVNAAQRDLAQARSITAHIRQVTGRLVAEGAANHLTERLEAAMHLRGRTP